VVNAVLTVFEGKDPMLRIALALAALATAAVPATPATAAQIAAQTSVNVVKPVALTKLQDMDFGSLAFSSFTGTRTITISQAGALTCAADIVCSGAPKAASFNVQGTNRMVVLISVAGGTMSNGTESIPFTPNAPASITMVNSGAPGFDFGIGGSISVDPGLVGGLYTGTMTVTADYQ
jgi:hypothetical protein